MEKANRRSFLKTSLAGAVLAGLVKNDAFARSNRGGLRKSLYYGMLPSGLSVEERFALARRVGFEGVEVPTVEDAALLAEMKAASAKTGLLIHSIMNQRHWKFPLSSADPATIQQSMEGMEISLRNAKEFGADTVLLVPGVVNADTSYQDAWDRSRKYIRELLPLAGELKVVIAIENVWNKFLLSPLEFARYVDEFKSPWLRAYFDVGNIALYGIPRDWIRTLGKRIVKVHIKGFDEKKREFVALLDGTIDWKEVRTAFAEVGYQGWVSAEVSGGDENYLRGVSAALDTIFAG
ncbi:MAG: sugar phosphate isomerase/epimerase family protein [Candidatus Latescibacterota bacterium]